VRLFHDSTDVHVDVRSTARREQLQALQLRGMRFADEYVGAGSVA
jgi:hypothetical protein